MKMKKPKNKRIFFVFHGRFPSEKADSLFAALDAQSFVEKGMEVVFIAPRRFGRGGSPKDFYGLRRDLPVVYLPTLDVFWTGFYRPAFWASILFFSLSLVFYLFIKARKGDIVYSNEIVPLFFASLSGMDAFYEMHDYPESKKGIFGFFLRKMRWVLIHNKWKTEKAISEFGLSVEKIITAPNAVSLEDFDIKETKSEAREKLGLDQDKKIIVYTGHLYSWKGADTLADCAMLMPEADFYFIGGNRSDIEKMKAKYAKAGNLYFTGFRPHGEMPFWQKAADVLVVPNTAKEDISKYYTSPMKLFEYMAGRTPIVASRIPSIEEIISESEAYFSVPDDAESLCRQIRRVLSEPAEARAKAEVARKKVERFTWEARAENILNFVENA